MKTMLKTIAFAIMCAVAPNAFSPIFNLETAENLRTHPDRTIRCEVHAFLDAYRVPPAGLYTPAQLNEIKRLTVESAALGLQRKINTCNSYLVDNDLPVGLPEQTQEALLERKNICETMLEYLQNSFPEYPEFFA